MDWLAVSVAQLNSAFKPNNFMSSDESHSMSVCQLKASLLASKDSNTLKTPEEKLG